MKNLILSLLALYLMLNLLFMSGRLFVHSDEIKICIKKEAYVESLPFTKCPVDTENEKYICFLADYHGQDIWGNYYKITCNSVSMEFPVKWAEFVAFITKKGERKND